MDRKKINFIKGMCKIRTVQVRVQRWDPLDEVMEFWNCVNGENSSLAKTVFLSVDGNLLQGTGVTYIKVLIFG